MTIYVQVFCRQQLPEGKDWPLPRAEHWRPWVNCEVGDNAGLVPGMAAHRFMRDTGYLCRNSDGPPVVNLRVYHATDGDPWNDAGTQPLACRFSDFVFTRN